MSTALQHPVEAPRGVLDLDLPEPFGLEAAGVMACIVAERKRTDEAAARELRAVTAWADLHRCSAVGAVSPETEELLGTSSALLGLEGRLRLAGEGAFMVEEYAATELAAALGMSEAAARAYLGQAIELRDRLPRCFEAVMAGNVPAWKARKIAEQTIPLTAAAADYVDAHLASFAAKLSLTRILRTVEAATERFDPELARERAAAAAEHRGVWFDDHLDGTTSVEAVAETPDAIALDQALSQVAGTLRTLGDPDSLDVRRARALGVLADPQYALDLTSHETQSAGAGDPSSTTTARLRRKQAPLHLHLHVGAVSPEREPSGLGHLVRVDGLGSRSLEVVQRWLAGLTPGTSLQLTPVIDLTEHIAVDAYEAPQRLREQIGQRDHRCRFPWCSREGRYDLDHTVPYLSPDDGGPPGQTSSDNLVRLCRYHHRVKTNGGWHYTHDPGTHVLTWTSPLNRRYTVDEHGTYPHP